jgi:hypothetical protein
MMRWITEADCIRCGLRSSVTTKASQGPEIAIRVARLPWLFPFFGGPRRCHWQVSGSGKVPHAHERHTQPIGFWSSE